MAKAKKPTKDKIEHSPDDYAAKIVKAMIGALKGNGGRVWRDMSEEEQHGIIGLVSTTVQEQIKGIVAEQASKGYAFIPVTLGAFTFKTKGAALPLTVPEINQACHAAAGKVGTAAVLVLADPAVYLGGEMPSPDKDQPDLPFNEGDEDSDA